MMANVKARNLHAGAFHTPNPTPDLVYMQSSIFMFVRKSLSPRLARA